MGFWKQQERTNDRRQQQIRVWGRKRSRDGIVGNLIGRRLQSFLMTRSVGPGYYIVRLLYLVMLSWLHRRNLHTIRILHLYYMVPPKLGKFINEKFKLTVLIFRMYDFELLTENLTLFEDTYIYHIKCTLSLCYNFF